VLNVELLQGIDRALAGRSVEFEWVKGHSGHAMNEAADRRANAAATAFSKRQDPDVGPGYRGGSRSAGTAESSPATEADLFSLLEESAPVEDPTAPAEDGAPFEDVIAREQALLSDALRSDPPSAAQLLHPAFTEIGASGRAYDREEILAHLAPLSPGVRAEDFRADEIADGVILLRYATIAPDGTTLRSSLWVRERGAWQVRHHQGTPSGDD
ncbi:MAG: DUF4440 domain-containing protein, partial [Brachybacterium sp.]|nr:DUF4440 domain-containing protein [Brachybacterium sp.]